MKSRRWWAFPGCGARDAPSSTARAMVHAMPGTSGDLIHVVPAASLRDLPVVELDARLIAHEHGMERLVGEDTLLHGDLLHRD